MSSRQYRFRLDVSDTQQATVNPIYGDDLNKDVERESGQMFFREKLSGKLIFVRQDFDAINDADFGFEFTIHIDQKIGDNPWESDWWVGTFSKTDCEFDEDTKTVEVQPDPLDRYKLLMDNMDKEFNLIEVSPDTVELTLKVQPLIQFYILGSEVVTNLVGTTYWEQPVNTVVNFDLDARTQYFFAWERTVIFCTGTEANLSPDVSGYYTYPDYISDSGQYQFIFQDIGNGGQQWTIIDLNNSNAVVYEGDINVPGLHGNVIHSEPGTVFTSVSDPNSQCRVFAAPMYVRYLTNEETVNGVPTNPIPDDDMVTTDSRYKRVIGLLYSAFVASDESESTADRWGRVSSDAVHGAGDYFEQPVFAPSSGVGQTFPLARSEWSEVSWWTYYTTGLRLLQETGGTDYTLRHAYKLHSTIEALLQRIDPSLTHAEDSDHSEFFYGVNTIRGSVKIPIIAPKTNVTVGEYDKPAQRANIRMSDIVAFLKDFHQVYLHIDDQNRFRLEHIDFYDRGGTYSGQNVDADLTTLIEPKTKKNWSYKSKKYKFDKVDMPVQITHKWMDDSSEAFEGFPIEILSTYVQQGNFDERNLSIFTSDIDFIHAQTNSIAQDGFVFIEALMSGGDYIVPFVEFSLDWPIEYKMQNGYASMVWAADKYWRNDLPASSVRLNLQTITANSVKRNRIQEIEYPSPVEPDPMKLVVTSLGPGRITKMVVNLSSGSVRMTLKHGTE